MASRIGIDKKSRIEKNLGRNSSKVINKERTIDFSSFLEKPDPDMTRIQYFLPKNLPLTKMELTKKLAQLV